MWQQLPFNKTKQTEKERGELEEGSAASAGDTQLDTGGGRPGRRVWIIFGLGEFFGSSSSSASLSQTCTTTLGVDSVPACSSYFSPGSRHKQLGHKAPVWKNTMLTAPLTVSRNCPDSAIWGAQMHSCWPQEQARAGTSSVRACFSVSLCLQKGSAPVAATLHVGHQWLHWAKCGTGGGTR